MIERVPVRAMLLKVLGESKPLSAKDIVKATGIHEKHVFPHSASCCRLLFANINDIPEECAGARRETYQSRLLARTLP